MKREPIRCWGPGLGRAGNLHGPHRDVANRVPSRPENKRGRNCRGPSARAWQRFFWHFRNDRCSRPLYPTAFQHGVPDVEPGRQRACRVNRSRFRNEVNIYRQAPVTEPGAVTFCRSAETGASHFHLVFAEPEVEKMGRGCALRGHDGVIVQARGREVHGTRASRGFPCWSRTKMSSSKSGLFARSAGDSAVGGMTAC